MPKSADEEKMLALASDVSSVANQLREVLDRKKRENNCLSGLEDRCWEAVRRVDEITHMLKQYTEKLFDLTHERTARTGELRKLVFAAKELASRLRSLRSQSWEVVGRDSCPVCCSTNVVPIIYGEVDVDPDLLDTPFVRGGCSVNFDETECCADCGVRFMGNIEKWLRANRDSG